MSFTFPDRLFRFRSAQSRYFADEIKKAFEERKIFCTPIDGQNDPYDSRPAFQDSSLRDINVYLKATNKRESIATKDALERHYPDKYERKKAEKKLRPGPLAAKILIKSINQQVSEFRTRTKIACLTERWDSILMWSHYTNAHSGICIEYRVHNPTTRTVHQTPYPVRYTSNRTKLDTLDLIALVKSPDIVDDAVNEKAQRCMTALILEKSLEWEYEKEWRVKTNVLEPPGYFVFENLEPVGVILGVNSTHETLETLDRVLPSGVAKRKVELDGTHYKLNLVNI